VTHVAAIGLALNEEEAIQPVERKMPRHIVDEGIVVDHGSTDRTGGDQDKPGAEAEIAE
jgi:hypothetical protein